MITKIKDCVYDNKYYWSDLNLNANVTNCLPNCTTLCYGAIIQDGKLPPVSVILNANLWHTVLTNGWTCIGYDYDKLEVGDIIEWTNKNHVAVVSKINSDKKIISASFYTGDDGTSKSRRYNFNSMEQVSNYMLTNYETRYFHCWSIEDEQKAVGALPTFILKHPLYSVERNTIKDQIEVLTYQQNVRDSANNILKKAERGFYDVLSISESNGYTWYEVEENKYIAGVEGRVIFYPNKEDGDLLEENKVLKKEVEGLKLKLDKIMEVAKYE